MNLAKKIGVSIAVSALMAVSATPSAFAATDVDVHGNGAFSDNDVRVANGCSTSVNQSNVSNISNTVATNANTGGNRANFNTGGSVTIVTGDATSDVDISNAAGSNVASVPGGCGSSGATDVNVSGNGAFSDTDVTVRNWDQESWRQYNANYLRNQVYTNLNTGRNSANFNTDTDVVIKSGDANSDVTFDNQAGSNVLH